MIKVIKHGKHEFIAICAKCGCEFSYELSDLEFYGLSLECVYCPECGEKHIHSTLNTQVPEKNKENLMETKINGTKDDILDVILKS